MQKIGWGIHEATAYRTVKRIEYIFLKADEFHFPGQHQLQKSESEIKVMAALNSVDLSTYIRVGRYDLPEPTRTTAPTNSLLAQEVSAVTYNWDTDTLFVVGDGSTLIVQVSKTGQLIDSMTLAPGSSPQGTDFVESVVSERSRFQPPAGAESGIGQDRQHRSIWKYQFTDDRCRSG